MESKKDTAEQPDHNTDNVQPQNADQEARKRRLARPRGRTFDKRGQERQK